MQHTTLSTWQRKRWGKVSFSHAIIIVGHSTSLPIGRSAAAKRRHSCQVVGNCRKIDAMRQNSSASDLNRFIKHLFQSSLLIFVGTAFLRGCSLISRATSLGSSGNWLMSGVHPAQPSMQGHSLDKAQHGVPKHWQPWIPMDMGVFKQQMVLGV